MKAIAILLACSLMGCSTPTKQFRLEDSRQYKDDSGYSEVVLFVANIFVTGFAFYWHNENKHK